MSTSDASQERFDRSRHDTSPSLYQSVYINTTSIHHQTSQIFSLVLKLINQSNMDMFHSLLTSVEVSTTTKVVVFLLVQALVYFILSKSSNLFSTESTARSLSFRTVRSVSIRRLLAAISDLPGGGETSPSGSRPAPGLCRTPPPSKEE